MYKLSGDRKVEQITVSDNRESQAEPEDRRLVEVTRDDGNFHSTDFKDLKKGDCFSMFDHKTKQPIMDVYGNMTHVASTDAYLAKHKTLGITVYHIQIEDMLPPTGEEDAVH
jgi:hypothetical protein